MSLVASPVVAVSRGERLEMLFEEMSELAGQRNAIDGRLVEIAAELERDELWGTTGARSVAALLAWKMGCSSGNAHTITTVASRLEEFPRCTAELRRILLSQSRISEILERLRGGVDRRGGVDGLECGRDRLALACQSSRAPRDTPAAAGWSPDDASPRPSDCSGGPIWTRVARG